MICAAVKAERISSSRQCWLLYAVVVRFKSRGAVGDVVLGGSDCLTFTRFNYGVFRFLFCLLVIIASIAQMTQLTSSLECLDCAIAIATVISGSVATLRIGWISAVVQLDH